MDTQTSYFVNGDINMYACPWVEEPTLVEGSKTSYRGRITVMSNGDTHFKAYREGTKGSKFQILFQTDHCRMKLYNGGRIIEEWNYDKDLSAEEIRAVRKREISKVDKFYQMLP